MRLEYTSETVCTDRRVLDEIRERVLDRMTGYWKSPTVVAGNAILRVDDG